MEPDSEGEINPNVNRSPADDGPKRPKRQMKTPFQLEVLEKTYSVEMYPSEAVRVELSEKLGLTDRQLQMWFCHRRLKDKKEAAGMAAMKPRTTLPVGRMSLNESPGNEMMRAEPRSEHGSGSRSESGSGSASGSSQFDNGDNMPSVPLRIYEPSRSVIERKVIACVEAQLGEPLREDGPILGMEFDELPPGAFGAPIVPAEQQERYRYSFDSKSYGQYDVKQTKAMSNVLREHNEPKMKSEIYGHVATSNLYDSPIDGACIRSLPSMHGNGNRPREYNLEDQVLSVDLLSQPGRQGQFSVSPQHNDFISQNEDNLSIERKRKVMQIDEPRSGRDVQAHEKRIKREQEKQELLRRKMEEQTRKEMERQDRERRKEEQRMIREQQRQEEKFQREERREMERREKFMQKELIRAERRKVKEERRLEKEAARQKAAMERAAARKIAKESTELIEDERLELMELAASRKGVPSFVALDYDTLQNLEPFREALCQFPPKSVRLKKPFRIQPWIDSDENVGNLLMVWRFCMTFADVLGLWPFTLDEFVQSFHDYDSRLLAELHISLLKLIIKDIEDVVRTPTGGPGTNQYSAINAEGGHPQIVEGAYLWGFDIRSWQKHLNPLTWPEILRQFALAAGFGPLLKKKSIERASMNENDESKSCEDIISTLRNGSAAENAAAIMQEKGFSSQRKSRHRLTPGTVKFAAYHVLALEGSQGLNVIELADKIQKSGLRDLTTSKTPEASISVALSRDPILFERIAPSTYNVRPAFRKDPADAESVLATAREKIQRYANGFLAGQNADEEEKDDESDSDDVEAPEVDGGAPPPDAKKEIEPDEGGSGTGSGKGILPADASLPNGIDTVGIGGNSFKEDVEIDESKSGCPWVQGLTEGEYSDLSVEERLGALVSLIGVANEGNSIRVILEDRMDAANALKKQMYAESQLDKRRMREETMNKIVNGLEGGQSPFVVAENRNHDPSVTASVKDEPIFPADAVRNFNDSHAQDVSMNQSMPSVMQNGNMTERSRLQLKSYIGHRAEEIYEYRSLPLGQDRRRNRYWHFVASASGQDPGYGRIFVELHDGSWRLIDSEEAFDALLTSMDLRGTRESHLYIMLQKIKDSFKEQVQRNRSLPNVSDSCGKLGGSESVGVTTSPACGTDSPLSAVCSANTDTLEPSLSFDIHLGKSEMEKTSFLKRYEDLQIWTWKECFNSLTLCAMAYGKKRCSSLLQICDVCLSTCLSVEDLCPSCRERLNKSGGTGNLLEQINHGDRVNVWSSIVFANLSPPVRIRLIKALLNWIEVSVPAEALHPSWTENQRNAWALKLQNSSSIEDLLQSLTQLEAAIKRENLSADFETTEEMLNYCASLRGAAYAPGCLLQLPWIPQTTAAVALRVLELDASISYIMGQKAESRAENEAGALPKVTLKYSYKNDIQRGEIVNFDRHGALIEENWAHPHDTPGSSGYKQVIRGRGGGRPRGKSQKRVAPLKSGSGRRVMKQVETLSQMLLQQGVRTNGQKHGRGRRTQRRRPQKKIIADTIPDYLGDGDTLKNVLEKETISGMEELMHFNSNKTVVENDGSSNSVEAGDSDDNVEETPYEFRGWGESYHLPSRGNEVVEMSDDAEEAEDLNVYEEEDIENAGGSPEMNNEESDREDRDKDEDSDSMVSGEYSD